MTKKKVEAATKQKIRIVIRNLNDLLDLQVLRWKRKYPDAAEPEEWSANEIKPGDHFDPTQEISEDAVKVIMEDDKRWVGADAGRGMKRRGTYERGYGKDHDAAFVAAAEAEHAAHYAAALEAAGDAMAKEFDLGDEYEIVFEGEYAEKIMAEQRKEKKAKD